MNREHTALGLDLGKRGDPTAVSLNSIRWDEQGVEDIAILDLFRFELDSNYEDMVDAVVALLYSDLLLRIGAPKQLTPEEELREIEKLRNRYPDPMSRGEAYDEVKRRQEHEPMRPDLVVDRTGVGDAVLDMLKKRKVPYRAVHITGSAEKEHDLGDRTTSVPKKNLCEHLIVPWEMGRLRLAHDIPLLHAFREELKAFRMKRKENNTGYEYYEHWRVTDHDDMVLAAALACWWLRKKARKPPPRGSSAVAGMSREDMEFLGFYGPSSRRGIFEPSDFGLK
jgi:hypothetical protein